MLILITVSTVLAFLISFALRSMGKNFLIAFIASSIVVEVVVIVYSGAVGGGFEDTSSIFENVRVVFLCFLGAMFAELAHSIKVELKEFANE